MGNYTFGAKTICPFYLREAKHSITCEGLIEGTRNMTRFEAEKEKKMFQQTHCERYDYASCCPLAAKLTQKYTPDEKDDANSVTFFKNIDMSLGEKIAVSRCQRGLSQTQLARKIQISRSYLSDIENNRRKPSIKTLTIISNVLAVSIRDLI